MLRFLLTCLAFLSGLVALGTPANAVMAESSVSRSAAEICETEKDDARCECYTAIRLRDWRIVLEKVCKPRTATIFIPTVYFGADRAYE